MKGTGCGRTAPSSGTAMKTAWPSTARSSTGPKACRTTNQPTSRTRTAPLSGSTMPRAPGGTAPATTSWRLPANPSDLRPRPSLDDDLVPPGFPAGEVVEVNDPHVVDVVEGLLPVRAAVHRNIERIRSEIDVGSFDV